MDKGVKCNMPSRCYCINCAYPVSGLANSRCPECGERFDPDDPRTWSSEPNKCHHSAPIAASFSGAMIGGAIVHGVIRLYEGYTSGYGHVTDTDYVTLWTAIAVVGWWTVVVVPGLLLDRRLMSLRSFWLSLGLGSLIAVAVLWVLLGLVLRSSPQASVVLLTFCAAFIGVFTAGAAFAASRRVWVRSAAGPPRRAVKFLWLLGPMCVFIWLVAVWPVLCRISPDLAYRVGDDQTRYRAIRSVLERVRVGDPASRLRKLLPSVFDTQSEEPTDRSWVFHIDGNTIEIEVEQGKIAHINQDQSRH